VTGSSDWRLTNQLDYLRDVSLVRATWVRPKPDWDHDHCAFCWAKFGDSGAPDVLNEGYCTLDHYHWICLTCYADFREQFGWHVSDE
jgi:hypothetical protein